MINTFQPAILALALIHRCAFCQPGRVWHCTETADTILADGALPNIFEGHKSCHLLLCSNVSCSLRMFNLVVSGPWFFSLEFFSKPEYVCGCMCVYMCMYVSVLEYVCVICACICVCLFDCVSMCVVYAVCVCICVFMCVWPWGVCMDMCILYCPHFTSTSASLLCYFQRQTELFSSYHPAINLLNTNKRNYFSWEKYCCASWHFWQVVFSS